MRTYLLKGLIIIAFSLALYSCQDAVRLELSQRVDTLVKDTVLYDHLWLDFDGISVYASAKDKKLNDPECKIYYHELEAFRAIWDVYSEEEILKIYLEKGLDYFDPAIMDKASQVIVEETGTPSNPLQGKRIAIDPVHIGGSFRMAALEGKLLKVLRAPQDTVFFDEGSLTLAVARIMQAKLKKEGATLLLTREKPGISALGKGFYQWLKDDFKASVERDRYLKEISVEDANFLLNKADEQYIYNQFFKKKDMLARAKKINNFRPHVTYMLRFNVHEPNWKRRDANGVMRPAQKNYSMAFVPGGFMAGELSTPKDRLEFLRLLVTNHLNKSVEISQETIIALRYGIDVLPVDEDNTLDFIKESCVWVNKGIYARNLSMTRLVHSPLCYAEPLCLDYLLKSEDLLKKEVKVGDDIISSLLAEKIADAYITALKAYFTEGTEVPLTEDDIVEEEL